MSEYKRLTRKDEKGRWVAKAGFYGVYLDDNTNTDMMHGELVDRLSELEDKIESGELIERSKVDIR